MDRDAWLDRWDEDTRQMVRSLPPDVLAEPALLSLELGRFNFQPRAEIAAKLTRLVRAAVRLREFGSPEASPGS